MPKKILYLSSTNVLHDGGALCLMKIVAHAAEAGHTPLVVMPERGAVSRYYEQQGVAVRIVPYNRVSTKGGWLYRLSFLPKFYRSIRRIARLIEQEKVDLVHVNELLDFNGLIAARRAGIPAIAHVRMIVERPAWARRVFVGAAKKYGDRIVCVSKSVRQKMFEGQGLAPERLCVVYDGGPDLERFDPGRVQPVTRQALGIPPQAFVVGLVSKMVRVKGHDHLLRAMARLKSQGQEDLYCVLVGGKLPGHEDYFEEIQKLISAEGLQQRVIQTGGRDDVPELLSLFDVYTHLPTYQDPFPGVVLEAMAMERPVVAYDSGGIGEQLGEGRAGVLVPQGDVERLAGEILDLKQNVEKRRQLGREARRFLLEHFSLERHFHRLDAIYEELCSV